MSETEEPPGGQQAARLRAAIHHGRVKIGAAANALNVSETTMKRMLAGPTDLSSEQRATLTLLTGVPPWFLEYGFAPPPQTAGEELLARVQTLERQVTVLTRRAAASDPADVVPPASTPRRGKVAPPSTASGKPSPRRKGAGSP